MSSNFNQSNTEPIPDKNSETHSNSDEEVSKPNKPRSNTDPVIGIDLGTTYSSVGICKNNKIEIIANELGNRTTPSYVSFNENGQRFIGDAAKNQLAKNHASTIFDVKRLMGREWDDEFVQTDKEHFPFPVVEKNARPHIEIVHENGSNILSPEEVSAMVLKKLAKIAQERIGREVKDVVITVPAYFNDAQRQATKNAGTIAGLNVLKILNEPTAAAMAYALNTDKAEKIILVFDLGGGTLDISIMSIKDYVFTVLSTCGNTHLGGEDFDQRVVNYFIKLYQTEKGKDFSKDNRAIQRLRREVEKGKKELTHHNVTIIELDGFFDGEDFSEILTKEKFEELNKDLFLATLKPLKQALDDAKLQKSEIDDVVMVGGSSRIPKIRELVSEFFDGKELCQKINPDEAIASGAAIQAGILSGQQDSVVLHDVIPLSLGIELYSQKMDVFIPRNTLIPTIKTKKLTTAIDYQPRVMFAIYQGELPVAKDNLFLGKFILSNIELAPVGVPKLITRFEIDENGILNVSAEDGTTKEKKDISIDYSNNRPTAEEIKQMMQLSEEYDKLDEKFNESINLRIQFREELYSIQNLIDDKELTDSNKENILKSIEENLKWLEDNKICDIEEYKERQAKFAEEVKTLSMENKMIKEEINKSGLSEYDVEE